MRDEPKPLVSNMFAPRTDVARVGAINNLDDFKSLLINTINQGAHGGSHRGDEDHGLTTSQYGVRP